MRLALTIVALALSTASTKASGPTVPRDAKSLYVTDGRGVQVYRCTSQQGVFEWGPPVPEAKLFATGTQQKLGAHSEGPIWTWNDGSAVRGKVVRRVPSPDRSSVPWLLLSTQPLPGTTGALASVVWVRRSETHGGIPPAGGCDAAHSEAVVRIPYIAIYTFYTGN